MGEECASVGASRVKSIHGSFLSLYGSALQRGSFVLNPYVELQDQWNGPYFFFLKSHISAPGAQNSPIFFLV